MRNVFGLGLIIALAVSPVLAQETVTAQSGQETRVGWIGSLKADCSPNPAPKLRPAKLADHGQIKLVPAEVTTNKVANCPNAKVPAVVVFYTSSAVYKGTDTFTLASDGTAEPSEHTYTISVQ